MATRRVSELLLLGVVPVLLVALVIARATQHDYGFDFHGGLWVAGRDILHGRNPYPLPTIAGVLPGARLVYPPAIVFAFIPLAILPYPLAAALLTVLLLGAVAATLYLLEVRDWRCYGATYLTIPVLHDIRLGAISILLALAVALAWRWRNEDRVSIALAAAIVAKVFLWPLGVWLLVSGRLRGALWLVLCTSAAVVLSWAAIGFAGLVDYPRLLLVLSGVEQAWSYSPVAAVLGLGFSATAARIVAGTLGLALLVRCARDARRGDDARALTAALAASLVLTPIVWPHYFVLLLVPIALARRSFGWLWLMPVLFWGTPFEQHHGQDWRIAIGLGVATVILAASWRQQVAPSEM